MAEQERLTGEAFNLNQKKLSVNIHQANIETRVRKSIAFSLFKSVKQSKDKYDITQLQNDFTPFSKAEHQKQTASLIAKIMSEKELFFEGREMKFINNYGYQQCLANPKGDNSFLTVHSVQIESDPDQRLDISSEQSIYDSECDDYVASKESLKYFEMT